MTFIIDGRQIAAELQFRLRAGLAQLNYRPNLVVIRVGDDPASALYVQRKAKTARDIGINAGSIHLPIDLPETALLDIVRSLNADRDVHAILVQLPLPPHIDPHRIIEAIDPRKDVDGFHPVNMGRLGSGSPYHIPCTPKGILKLLATANVVLPGARVLMIGCGPIVGQPLAVMLTRAGATVTVAHKLTRNLPAECLWAEVIIVAAGCPRLVRGSFVRKDAVVIDVGINRLNGQIVGDVAFDECVGIARAITPVPGGVGPMTVACLLENTIGAAKLQHRMTYCEI